MSNITVGAHVFTVLLVLLQCGLAAVLAYRLYLLSHTYHGGVHPHQRLTTVNMLRVHRVCIFIMTALQCVRCVDPFASLGIWSYYFTRTLQLAVTILLYFQYSTTTFVCMDTLYACALKRTPYWLTIIVSILPALALVLGLFALVAEFVEARQWVTAALDFFIVVSVGANLTTYNVSGACLIQILRKHQLTGSGEEISGSKSASPFALVISKTLRSMWLLSLPSVGAMVMFGILAVGLSNNKAIVAYNPSNPAWNVFATIFLQLVLGLLFTRMAWVSKTALDAEILASVNGSSRESEKRSSGMVSRADSKARAMRLTQSPIPRNSESPSTQNSQAEPEPPVVAVTVVDDSNCDQPVVLPSPCTEIVQPGELPITEIV